LKRQKLLHRFRVGEITRAERIAKMELILRDVNFCTEQLVRQPASSELSPRQLAHLVTPFLEWRFLGWEEKRRLLASRLLAIHVTNCRVEGISVLVDVCGNEHRGITASETSITRFACHLGCEILYLRMPS